MLVMGEKRKRKNQNEDESGVGYNLTGEKKIHEPCVLAAQSGNDWETEHGLAAGRGWQSGGGADR